MSPTPPTPPVPADAFCKIEYLKQWGEVVLTPYGTFTQWEQDSFCYVKFANPVKEDEFSIKVYGGYPLQEVSFRIPAGVTEFEITGDLIPLEIAEDCERVGLLYRLANVPNIVYLENTEIEVSTQAWSDILPTPLKADNAIVTGL